MKNFEVGFNIRGNITVTAENQAEAHNQVKNSDNLSTYELFDALSVSISEIGNDAITIDDVYKTPNELIQTTQNLWVNYRENEVLKSVLIRDFSNKNHHELIHQQFKEHWGEGNTICKETGTLYISRANPTYTIQVDKIQFITDFEAEILQKYL